jgi:hypothetical protein
LGKGVFAVPTIIRAARRARFALPTHRFKISMPEYDE